MTIKEMQERKRELGYNNRTLAEKSGVPLSTVQKILGGKTRSPRMATIQALESVLADYSGRAYEYKSKDVILRESAASYAPAKNTCTIKDLEALPDDVRAELIDGQIFLMSAPGRIHQEIVTEMLVSIHNYIKAHDGSCKVYPSPFGVYLNGEAGQDFLEPDLIVVCDQDRLQDKGCIGAPDWVMEVISPSTRSRDYAIKLFKYRTAGVKEYWIVNPEKTIVTVYQFDKNPEIASLYSFDDEIPVALFPGLTVCLSELVQVN